MTFQEDYKRVVCLTWKGWYRWMRMIYQKMWRQRRRKGGENGVLWSKWKLDLLELSHSPRSQDPLWKEIVIDKAWGLAPDKSECLTEVSASVDGQSLSWKRPKAEFCTKKPAASYLSRFRLNENWSKLYPCVMVSQPNQSCQNFTVVLFPVTLWQSSRPLSYKLSHT